jgi:site-specific DNA-methyltransferase (adenine-specific)
MNNIHIHFSSKSNEWATPQDFFDQLNKEFKFTLDPCATKLNAKCKNFFTIKEDGLRMAWGGYNVFCNPPYGRGLKFWVKKAHEESLKPKAKKIVLLIPARTDTSYFHDYIYGKAEIRFIRGRLKFGDSKNSAPFPSMVVVFN